MKGEKMNKETDENYVKISINIHKDLHKMLKELKKSWKMPYDQVIAYALIEVCGVKNLNGKENRCGLRYGYDH